MGWDMVGETVKNFENEKTFFEFDFILVEVRAVVDPLKSWLILWCRV